MAFQWNIKPTGTNIYVDKKGDDTTGVIGDPQLPYKSIAKATSVGTSGNNIILGNGVWEEQRTLNNKYFNFYGSGMTWIRAYSIQLTIYGNDTFKNIKLTGIVGISNSIASKFDNCIVLDSNFNSCSLSGTNSIFIRCSVYTITGGHPVTTILNCILINNTFNINQSQNIVSTSIIKNNIIINTPAFNYSTLYPLNCDFNNYTNISIPTTNGCNSHSINDASTGQTVTDYFNSYNAAIPELSDFTAKSGSKNIRAGYGNGDIGFSQGFGRSASASEFTTAGGAILKGLSLVNGQIVLSQCNLFTQSATSNSITLDNSASAVDDHFKDLYIRITGGTGVGQLRLITAYNGTTKVATISGTWDVIPDSSSTYTCSGYLESADIDLGKIVKVKRNWFDGQFGYDLTTVTGVYNQKTNATDNDYTNKTFAEFGMKFSKLNDLASKSWNAFSPNGSNLFDGTYGDGETGYTIANGQYMIFRYCKIKFNVAI